MTTTNTQDAGTFNKGKNAGTAVCTICGTRRQKANMQRTNPQEAICNDCYEQAGRENAHADGHHDATPDPLCPDCSSAVVNEDGTPTQETIDMLTNNGRAKTTKELREGDVTTMVAADVAKARVQDRADAIKAKQTAERKAERAANGVKATATKKAAGTSRAVKVTTPKVSKASSVRALLDQGKTVRECADALKDLGVTWSYAWDVAAAYEKTSGKVFIPSHAPKAAPKTQRARTSKKAALHIDEATGATVLTPKAAKVTKAAAK